MANSTIAAPVTSGSTTSSDTPTMRNRNVSAAMVTLAPRTPTVA